MPEYNKSDIPVNDSHLLARTKVSQAKTMARAISPEKMQGTSSSRAISHLAAFFLVFWVVVAAAAVIYRQQSKTGGAHHAKSIGHETESAPSQKTPKTKNLTTSQRAKNHSLPQKINPSSIKGKSSASTPKPRAVNTSGIWVEKKKRTNRKATHGSSKERNVKALQKKARELARQGKWAEAAKLAAQVVDNAPGSLKDRRFLGLCLLSASQYQKGIEELEKVIKDGQTDVVIEHRLGHAYEKAGSYDNALNAFKKAIALDPANPRHYKCGAQLIAAVSRLSPGFNGNLALAKTWYAKALALGMQPAELAKIKRLLEKNGRRV